MEADVVEKHQAMNPCCAALKEKYAKLEATRNALRQGVKIQNELIDKLQDENLNLKKANEEGIVQADIERQEKAKETDIRISLESEVCALKSEILSLQQRGRSESHDLDGEVMLLQTRISEGETEINRLKELLEKERVKAESESKKAEAEKNETNKVRKIIEAEKSKANEDRTLADIEIKKLKENTVQFEKLKVEAKKKLEAERQKVMKEKKRAESEMAKAEEQRKLAEMNQQKAIDEQCRANNLSQQLQEHKQRIEKLQKEMDEQVSSRKLVKMPTDLSVKEMNPEIAKGRGGLPLERLKWEMHESKLVSEDLASEKVNKSMKEQKQMAIREKRRADTEMRKADTEMRKAEEHRMVAEANKIKAMEEKHRADQLAQQLEDNRRKIEGLQNEILELASSRKLDQVPVVPPDIRTNTQTAKMRLLKEKLKFKKKQLKHAQEVAKLEIHRNKLLQHELHCLKEECVQFSHRLDLLNNSFSYCSEGRDDQAKGGNVFNTSFDLKRKLFTKESHQMYLHCHKDLDASDFMKQTIDCNAPLLPFSVGNCAQCTSGIDSKMEPLLRGSNRKMLQSSALNSSTSSFSDGPLMGSQERGAFSVMASAIVAGEKSKSQSNISSLSGEVTRTRCIDAVGKKVVHRKKRKSIVNAVKSIEHLYSEGKNWMHRIEEKLSMLHGMLNSPTGKSLPKEKGMMSNLERGPIAARVHKKRKASPEELALKHLCGLNGQKDMQGGEVQAFEDIMGDSGTGNLGGYDEMEGNYMKLLNLDNAADEERYCKAIQAPLSPTLPAIEFQKDSFEVGNTKGLVDEISYKGILSEKVIQGPSCKIDVNISIESHKWKSGTSETSHVPTLKKDGGNTDPIENLTNNGNGKGTTTLYEDNACSQQMQGSHAERGKPDIHSSGYDGANISCQSALVRASDDFHRCYVVFSDTTDCSSMSRIFCAAGTCMSQFSTIAHTDLVVQNILPALLNIEDLSHKEKACVFFSVLLNKISGIALEKCRNFLNSDSILFLESFAGHMLTVVSDMQIRCMLTELCASGELLILIEDFLVDRRILVYKDFSSHSLPLTGSRVNIVLNGKDVHLSYEMALTHQLVAGSILLAALCSAVDHIGFLCEASYNIFRMRTLDASLVVTILHVFAYVCGSKYFNHKDRGLIMTVIKSLVLFIEKKNIASDSTSTPEFPTCSQCPFSQDAVSVDIVVSSLLQELENYALSGNVNQESNEVVNSLASVLVSANEKTEKAWRIEGELNLQPMNCSASCCLIKLDMPAPQFNSVCDGNLCHVSDIFSLVELVACNVSWDWTCNNIVHQLFKLLESCAQENFFAVIVVLLGNLGRLRVDASGYDDKGVEDLRRRLSSFLCQNSSRKLAQPSQIAIVNALLGVLPPNFDQLIESVVELPVVVSPSNPTDCIREWYSRLSNEQQSLSFSLLQSAGVSCCTTIAT